MVDFNNKIFLIFILPAFFIFIEITQLDASSIEKDENKNIDLVYITETKERKTANHKRIDYFFHHFLDKNTVVNRISDIQDKCNTHECALDEAEKHNSEAVLAVNVTSEIEKKRKPLGTEGEDRYIIQVETIVEYTITVSLYETVSGELLIRSQRKSGQDGLRNSVNAIVRELELNLNSIEPLHTPDAKSAQAIISIRNIHLFPAGSYSRVSEYGTGAAVSIGLNARPRKFVAPVSIEGGFYYHGSARKNIDSIISCYTMLTIGYGIDIRGDFILFPSFGAGYSWHFINKNQPAKTEIHGHPRGTASLGLLYPLTEKLMLNISGGAGLIVEPDNIGYFYTSEAGFLIRF